MDDYIFQHEGLVFDHAEGEFETLKEFLFVSAQSLIKEHADYIDWHNKQQKNYPLILDDLYNEDYIDNYLEGLSKHGRTFPKILLYSIIIMACSLFERNMRLVCRVMNHFKITELQWDDLRGTVVDKTVKLLRGINIKFEGERDIINTIRNYYMIRNCIVHHNGLIQEYRNKDKLMTYATELGLLSDASSEPTLELDQNFCEQVCETFISLFLSLSLNYTGNQTRD